MGRATCIIRCLLVLAALNAWQRLNPLMSQDRAVVPSELDNNPTANVAAEQSPELWFGQLDAKVRRFRFVVRLQQDETGAWGGQLESLDEGGAKFRLDSVARSDGKFGFELKATQAVYAAKLHQDEQVATGIYRQHGAEFELNFERVAAVPERAIKTYWTGKLNAIIQKLDVAFIELDGGDVLFDSVSQKAGGFLATMSRDGDQVRFEVPGVQGSYTGKLSSDGLIIEGEWKQGFASLELVLTQSEPRAIKPPQRPQTPLPPFPYEIKDIKFTNSEAGIELAGILTIPAGDQIVPAVVLISGSGPQDRDETILDHKPFWVLADHLARNQIACLRFDDRGVGKSQGNHAQATSQDFASDVGSAYEFLRSQPRVDPKRVGLCGHSEGGLIAPMLASQAPSIAFIILMAGPGVNGKEILLSQNRLLLKAAGVSEEEFQRQLKIQSTLIELGLQRPLPSVDVFAAQAREKLTSELSLFDDSATEQIIAAASGQLLSPWFQYFMVYEPAPTLAKVQCRVLALFGEKDLQVDPLINAPAIRAALALGQNPDFEVRVFPNLNHLFQSSSTGRIDEYADIEETIAPVVLDAMTDWIQKK